MKIQLNISNAEYVQSKRSGNKSLASKDLVKNLEQVSVLHRFNLYQEYGNKIQKSDNVSSIISQIILKRNGIYLFHSDQTSNFKPVLTVSAFKSYLNLYLDIEILDNIETIITEVDGLIKSALEVYEATKTELVFGLANSIKPVDLEYPPINPPKFWRFYEKNALVDIVSFNALNEDFTDMIKITQNLVHGDLPKKVKRIKYNEFVYIINWLPLLTEFDINGLLIKRAKWFQDNSDFMDDPSFNEYGDSLFVTINLESDSYFTFHDSFTGNYFKAVVLNTENSKEIKRELNDVLIHKCNSKDNIYLILNNKAMAQMIRSTAIEMGFTGVLYPDNDGQYWLTGE